MHFLNRKALFSAIFGQLCHLDETFGADVDYHADSILGLAEETSFMNNICSFERNWFDVPLVTICVNLQGALPVVYGLMRRFQALNRTIQ